VQNIFDNRPSQPWGRDAEQHVFLRDADGSNLEMAYGIDGPSFAASPVVESRSTAR